MLLGCWRIRWAGVQLAVTAQDEPRFRVVAEGKKAMAYFWWGRFTLAGGFCGGGWARKWWLVRKGEGGKLAKDYGAGRS
jgi:hypothetical protein